MRTLSLFLIALILALPSFAQKGFKDIEKELQTKLIMAEDGEVIEIPAGKFSFKGSLSLDGKKNVTLKGAGMSQTLLSFKGQADGAEGLKVTECQNLILEGFTIVDSKGDAIKVQDTDGLVFRNIKTDWSGKPKKTNGSYGFYPVQCKNVVLEDCHARGASDAGIYVGQTEDVVVRRCKAWGNVAGIEIENCIRAEVLECEAWDNTGGILVFDMPGLKVKNGGFVKVHDNNVHNNNYKNFAPKGNIVGKVPKGTGMMVMAGKQIEIYDNQIINHKTAPVAIISWFMTEQKHKDKEYDPYAYGISIHDNSITRKKQNPTFSSRIGKLLWLKFKRDVPEILYDGVEPEDARDDAGKLKAKYEICIRDNGDADFANLDAGNNFENIARDLSIYNCARELEWTKK